MEEEEKGCRMGGSKNENGRNRSKGEVVVAGSATRGGSGACKRGG